MRSAFETLKVPLHKSSRLLSCRGVRFGELRNSSWPFVPFTVGFVGVILAKLGLIAIAANPSPFWDQWDGEAAGLYKPWLEGSWTWRTFVAPHNEHRLLPTRLVHLALFEALGRRWNPVAQMTVNAVLHAAAIVALAGFVASALPRDRRWTVWIFAAALHAVPFGWDNTLQGFNTHFYVLLLLTCVLLWLCTIAAGSNLHVCLAAMAAAGMLVVTMASGLLGVCAAVAVLISRHLVCRDRTAPAGLAVALAGIAVGGFLLTPEIANHRELRAQSVVEFIVGLGRVQAWPLPTVGVNIASALMPVVMQAPALIALAVAFRKRDTDRQAFLVSAGMIAWVWLQAAAIAYARYRSGLGSRYLDFVAAGTVLNFSAIVYLLTAVTWGGDVRGSVRDAVVGMAVVWGGAVVCGAAWAIPQLCRDVQTKIAESNEQERRVRAYLMDGDPQVLFDAGPMEIPYPDAARLRSLLDDPAIRSFLPKELIRE